jgi:hypothetical protein
VLTAGGWPDKPFVPSPWEWYFEAYAQPTEEGIETLEASLDELGENPALLYHLACSRHAPAASATRVAT